MTTLERFTKAGLPAPGTAGRLVELIDDDRSPWLDDGTQYLVGGGGAYVTFLVEVWR